MKIDKRHRYHSCFFTLMVNDKIIQIGNVFCRQTDYAKALKKNNPSDNVYVTITGSCDGENHDNTIVFVA